MLTLRPYQDKAVSNALEMINERGNSLIVAGTGAGKTIMMASFIGRYIKWFKSEHNKMPHILVLVHRTEIHNQNHSKFELVCPDVATSEITAARKSLKGYVHFGMVQTVSGLLPEFEKAKSYFDLIVIDEAHHAKASTYEDIIEWNAKGKPNADLLGVTATPNRGDELPLIDLFDNYYQITTKFLIDSHYLVRPTFIDLTPAFATDNGVEKGHLSKNISRDDDGQLAMEKLCDDYLANKQPGKTVIFAPTHELCVVIYNILKDKGRNPVYLSLGLDDDTRKSELKRFEQGDCEELINVDICTEGYDYPELRNLVDFDTNGTHGQWVQKVGRVLRTAQNKTSCTVIDFGGNIELYPQAVETDVNLEGALKKEKGQRLTSDDFFKTKQIKFDDGYTAELVLQTEKVYTPYNLPCGFETVNDSEFGIVTAACANKKDCIIVRKDNKYVLYVGNKEKLEQAYSGDYDKCIRLGIDFIGEFVLVEKPISKMQIKLLAPEYPTSALNFNGANCCICWKVWKPVIKDDKNA